MSLYLLLAVLGCYWNSKTLAVLAGCMLGITIMTAHNFFHKKDNFRMYYFDFSLFSHNDWRISHVISHHMFPNTILDLEVSIMEPFMVYLPVKKNFC